MTLPILLFIMLEIISVVGALLVLPLIFIIRCSTDTSFTPKRKAAWVAAMVIFWPFAGLLYGVVHEKNIWLKISTISCTVVFVLLVAFLSITGRLTWDDLKGEILPATGQIM